MENRLGHSVIRNFDYSQPFAKGDVNRGRKEHQSSHILSKTCLDLFLPSSDDSTNISNPAANLKNKEGEAHGSTKQMNTEGIENAATARYSSNGMKDGEVNTSIFSCTKETVFTGREDDIQVGAVRKLERNENILKKGKRPPPLVVFAYGGGWRRGDKQAWRHYISRWDINFGLAAAVGCDRFYSNVGESFACRGFPCAVLSYPLVPTPYPINLMEIGSSFLVSLAFVLLCILLSCFVLDVLLFSMSCQTLTYKFGDFLQSHSNFPLLSATAAVIILSQMFTLVIIVYRELDRENQQHSDTTRTVSRSVTILVAFVATITTVLTLDFYTLCSCIAKNNILTLLISGTTVIFVQYLVYHYQQMTTFDMGSKRSYLVASPQGQAESVALALRWLVDYGRSTGHFDPDSIILMGHSAGGHLVSLVALDHHYLTDVGICPRVIKGVITLSAVHDLQTFSKGFVYHIYLKPAFGTDPAHWTRMSPIQYVKLSENSVSNSDKSLLSQLPPSSSSSSSTPSSTTSSSSSLLSNAKSGTLHSPLSTSLSSALSPSSASISTKTSSLSLPATPQPPSASFSSLSSPSAPKTSLAPHRPHFLIISAAKDFHFMIEDSDRMHSMLKSNGYETKRTFLQGCNHFTLVRRFGCPSYRYWTGRVLGRRGTWEPNDAERMCREFVQQFCNSEKSK